METNWLTYREAADTLGLPSPAAAKLRAKRGRWPKRQGNDGLVRVQVPEGTNPHRPRIDPPPPKPDDPGSTPDRSQIDMALQALREQLSLAAERETRLVADLSQRDAQLSLADAKLESERARTEKAIDAFAALAERLDQLAAMRARPWWRRLTSG